MKYSELEMQKVAAAASDETLLQQEDKVIELIVAAQNIIPGNLEYALIAYVREGGANLQAVRDIMTLYMAGNIAEANRKLDLLDGQQDGRFGRVKIEGADVPRPKKNPMHDPGEGDASSTSRSK